MAVAVDVGSVPDEIQEYDGFDTGTIDDKRWNLPEEDGDTKITQSGGYLRLINTGGIAGTSYIESKSKFGKGWRISTDIKIQSSSGAVAAAMMLYKGPYYISIGPYKAGGINCNCYLRYKNAVEERGIALTSDVVDTTNTSSYTFMVISDTILIYYKGLLMTSVPMPEMHNYSMRLEGSTGSNGDELAATFNDYEVKRGVDTLLMTIGALVRDNREYVVNSYDKITDILAVLAGGISTDPTITDISGNITLSSTTEVFVEFLKSTYGKKFKVNMFADLEGCDINRFALLRGGVGDFVYFTEQANSLISNNIPLCTETGAQVGDSVYFMGTPDGEGFGSMSIYMEGGTSNKDNTYVWEYWNGSAYASISVMIDETVYNGKVFGKSGRVYWTTPLNSPWGDRKVIRARITAAGTSKPRATHIQLRMNDETGFDANAAFLSTLMIRVYRKRADGTYAVLPADLALPFTQCILSRNVEISNLPAWTDIKIGFKLSTTPDLTVVIPYTGYVETIEEND
jgi:hypothetical protein